MSDISPADSVKDEAADPGYEIPSHPWIVHCAIGLAVVLFLVVVTTLYIRWNNSTAADSFLIVRGDDELNGAVVMVDSPRIETIRRPLMKENKYEARLPLPAGNYMLRVTQGNQLIFQQTISLAEALGSIVDLPALRRGPTTRNNE